jgi:hypothetical protein
VNSPLAFRDDRRDQSQVAVDADETGMLNENFQASNATLLNPDNGAGRDRPNRSADGGGKINTIVERPREWPTSQNSWPKRRGDARRCERRHQRRCFGRLSNSAMACQWSQCDADRNDSSGRLPMPKVIYPHGKGSVVMIRSLHSKRTGKR